MSKNKLSREDELLIESFSSKASTKGSFLLYAFASVVMLGPIYLFYGVHQMEPSDSWFVWTASIIIGTIMLGTAYKNTRQSLKHQLFVKRGEAIAREVTREFADDKKMTKAEKDERILWKKSEVSDYEATTFAIFYNNALFIGAFLILSFYVFGSSAPFLNCIMSVAISGGLVALFSTSK